MTTLSEQIQLAEAGWLVRQDVQRQLAAERLPNREHSVPGWEALRARARIAEAFNRACAGVKSDMFERYRAELEACGNPIQAHHRTLEWWFREHQVGDYPWFREATNYMLMRMGSLETSEVPLVITSVETTPSNLGNGTYEPPASWGDHGPDSYMYRLLDGVHPVRLQDLTGFDEDGNTILDTFRPREESIEAAKKRIMAALEERVTVSLERIAGEDRTVSAAGTPVSIHRRGLMRDDADGSADWLIAYQFLGRNYADIATEAGVQSTRVGRAIRELAELAEFTLRPFPKGGRPKNAKDKALRRPRVKRVNIL